MKIRFLIKNLFLSLVVCSSLQGSDIPQGYRQIECTIKPMTKHAEHSSHPHIPGPRLADKGKAQATSTNWGGYVGATNLNNPAKNSVTAVYGSWIVPSVSPADNNTYSAIWVGIDGYTSPTVEQIGTSHNFYNGVQFHYAWFEMYPGSSYYINGFPLHPGDVISASVEFSGNNIFTMRLYNDTQKIVTTVPTSYTRSTTAQRKSAEWIVEAPYLNGILPLTNFTTAYLWGCIAKINGVLANIQNPQWKNTSVKMVTNNGTPKAIPSALLPDNGSFFMTWNHQ